MHIVEREEEEEEVEEEDGGRTKGFEWRHAVKKKYFRVRCIGVLTEEASVCMHTHMCVYPRACTCK